MSRPKLEKQTISAERMKKWRQNLSSKELKNKKKEQDIIKTKSQNQQNSLRKNGEKLHIICKALLREKQKEMLSRQKLQGLKIEERNRKRKKHSVENFSLPPSVMDTPLSTERVQKQRKQKAYC